MLFPGFVTLYKDSSGYIHLYFYPGIDNYNKYYYNNLDLSDCKIKYKEYKNEDGSIEFVFESKNRLWLILLFILYNIFCKN